jgi:putative PIN family toxin of toxin-antitoxin system
MRVILDSNILFSALISPHSPPHRIYQAWQKNVFELVTCDEQLDEIRQASRYPKFKSILQPHLVGVMLNKMQRTTVVKALPSTLYEIADPNDAWLLALAEKSEAHYLVTGDKQAGILSRIHIGQTQIVTATTFCDKVL